MPWMCVRPACCASAAIVVADAAARRSALRQQVEFYLSAGNLAKDQYLCQQMDAEGWVPLQLLANFNRVRSLCSDAREVREAWRGSPAVEVSRDGRFVRARAAQAGST